MPPKKKQPVVLPLDSIVKDVSKQVWRIGKRIGVGGFGEVFLCDKATEGQRSTVVNERTAAYVIKIEPSLSGPLFVEMHFYMRNASKDSIDSWVRGHKLDYLGMPVMHSKGQYEVGESVFRYIIIDRYAGDLDDLLKKSKDNRLTSKTAYTTAVRVLDVLEYIHSNDYIHADVKASNIMLGLEDQNRVYICDFGLACKFAKDGEHKVEKEDKKKMHNGTIEYTSRDAHRGMESRRADIEILAFNLVHWLSGKLPWLGQIKDCKAVAASKEKYMSNIKDFVQSCFGTAGNKTMTEFLSAVSKLGFDEAPKYEAFRTILKNGLKAEGIKYDGKILPLEKKPRKRKSSSDSLFSSDESLEEAVKKEAKPKKAAKPKRKQAPSTESSVSASSEQNLTPAMRLVIENKKKKDDAKISSRSTRSRNLQKVQ